PRVVAVALAGTLQALAGEAATLRAAVAIERALARPSQAGARQAALSVGAVRVGHALFPSQTEPDSTLQAGGAGRARPALSLPLDAVSALAVPLRSAGRVVRAAPRGLK